MNYGIEVCIHCMLLSWYLSYLHIIQLVLYRDVLRHCVPLCWLWQSISFARVYLIWQERRNLVRIKSLLWILLPRSPMYIHVSWNNHTFSDPFCAWPGHFGWREHEYDMKKLPEWSWSEGKMCVALAVAKFSAEATKCEPGLRNVRSLQLSTKFGANHLVLCRVGCLTRIQIDWSLESITSLINILTWTKPLCCEVKSICTLWISWMTALGFLCGVAKCHFKKDIDISKSQGLEMDFTGHRLLKVW